MLTERGFLRDRHRAREHLRRAQQSADALGMVRLGLRMAELAPLLAGEAHVCS